jgi:hypothetical protein
MREKLLLLTLDSRLLTHDFLAMWSMINSHETLPDM